MSKILVYGDLHFAGQDDFELTYKTCKWIAGKVEEHKPSLVVCLGDLNHYHQYIDIEALHWLYKGLEGISNACSGLYVPADHVVMSGNHDQCSKDVNKGVLSILGLLPSTSTVPEGPTVHGLRSGLLRDDYPEAVFLAFHRDINKFESVAKQYADPKRILFMHQDFRGAAPGADMVEPEWVSGYKTVFNGHVHKPQQIGNAVMVGSPQHHNFGDDPAEKRGCVLYDTETGEVQRLENPHTLKYVTVTDADSDETILLKAGVGSGPDPVKVCIRVLTSGTGDALMKRVERIKEMGYKSIKVVPAAKEEVQVRKQFDLTTDPNDIIDRYMAQVKPENLEGLSIQGKRIVEEAKA